MLKLTAKVTGYHSYFFADEAETLIRQYAAANEMSLLEAAGELEAQALIDPYECYRTDNYNEEYLDIFDVEDYD